MRRSTTLALYSDGSYAKVDDTVTMQKFHDAAKKATWAYLATSVGDQPKVRVVHPAFEGERVWIATGRSSPPAAQIEKNPRVELFLQKWDPSSCTLR